MTAIGVRVLVGELPMSACAKRRRDELRRHCPLPPRSSAACPRPSTPSASRRCSTARRSATSPTRSPATARRPSGYIAEMTMGTGALVMIGGTVGVAAFLTLASGGVIAVQGYSSLGNIGIEALTGFLSAFLNVRIVAPVIAGIALAATIGAGTTAQLGAMRVAEEIDAVESMAVHSVSYLVSTRLMAGTDRDHSAVFAVGAGGVLRRALHHGVHQRPVRRPLRPLLQYVPGADRSAVVVPAGHRDVDRRDAGAHLLRLQRIRWPGRRRASRSVRRCAPR